ncbi:MAG: NAD-binding protein, partial [Pseudomonadota bacterium]
GFLIVGANSVARAIAEALNTQGFHARLADSSWENISTARLEGFDTYYGNAVSEHADRHLDLIGLGQMLALTPQNDLNALACLRYRSEFGDKNVFILATGNEKNNGEAASRGAASRAQVMFGDGVTFAKLASLLGQGATIRQTKLSESFDFDTYTQEYGRRAIPLFGISPKGNFACFVANQKINPEPGWTIIALVQAEEKSVEQKQAAEGDKGTDGKAVAPSKDREWKDAPARGSI